MRNTQLLLCGVLIAVSAQVLAAAATPPALWRDIKAASIPLVGPLLITPIAMRSFAMDYEALRLTLSKAPVVGSQSLSSTVVELPMPDGRNRSFRMVEIAVMAPGLAAKYPSIKTYAGTAVDDALTTGRFDIGPRGFHGMIFTPRGTIYIDPFSRGDTAHYQSYFKQDARRSTPLLGDQVIRPSKLKPVLPKKSAASSSLLPPKKGVSIAGELRTYRLALAATGEYSLFHDPDLLPVSLLADKSKVLAEQVVLVNRVSGIYEREVGVRLQLIDGNDAAIFTEPNTDPYIDDQPLQLLVINGVVLAATVGPNSYDIGHVVSTGGGGVAGLGVVCDAAQKSMGVTGLPMPVADPFYVDYVAHEMGHQFGGNHTFNSDTGACTGGNRNDSTAYEPGSGTTIMAYAGICGVDNIARNSDDHFHAVSFDEIVAFTQVDGGNDCAVVTANGNRPPVADAGAGGFTIPKLTPFELTGTGSDPDGDAITYHWEQFDLGTPGLAQEPAADSPLFRSFRPSTSATRTFPQLSDLANNTQTIGEILPAVARELNFRLTVRDNRNAGGGTLEMPDAGGVASADLKLIVADVGPFLVLTPNGGESLTEGAALNVSWDVAGTDASPISCSNVDVLLSTDSGNSYPFTLAAAQANDGMQAVTLPPNSASANARVKVKCTANVFFDLSNADFTIASATTGMVPPGTPPVTPTPTPPPTGPLPPRLPPVVTPAQTPGRFGGSFSLLASLLLIGVAARRKRGRMA